MASEKIPLKSCLHYDIASSYSLLPKEYILKGKSNRPAGRCQDLVDFVIVPTIVGKTSGWISPSRPTVKWPCGDRICRPRPRGIGTDKDEPEPCPNS